jgi:hypothetical protein
MGLAEAVLRGTRAVRPTTQQALEAAGAAAVLSD